MSSQDLLQIVGALLVLTGFVGAQAGRLGERDWSYLLLNLVGSAILAILASIGARWGFLLLEGAWFVVTLVAVAAKLRGKAPPATH